MRWSRREETLSTVVNDLVDDTRSLARAELELIKARVAERIFAYRAAAGFFAVAGVLALAGLIALLVGVIISLAPIVGPAIATAIVIITVFGIAAVVAFIGKNRLAPAAVIDEKSV